MLPGYEDNPILGELDGLSGPAKAALAQAHAKVSASMAQPSTAQPATGQSSSPSLASSSPAPLASSKPVPTLGMGSPTPDATAHTAELNRLTSSGSGISQIHNGFGRGALQVADAIGGAFLPGLEARLPGTEGHHQMLVNQARGAVRSDEGQAENAARVGEQQAQTGRINEQTAEMPELTDAKTQATQYKHELDLSKQGEKTQHDQAQVNSQLHQHGYKQDANGNVVPLEYGEMSQDQQAVHDLKASQSELADANKALRDAQKSNIPAQMQMAQQRIDNAQRNAGIASQRLGLSTAQYNMRAHGTDNQGNALPGSMIGDDGKSVGTGFQQNVRPTGQERNKADLASSAHGQLDDLKGIVAKRPDIFGPAAGRKTDFNVWLGSQDPDAQRFRAARTIAGDHLAGVFGGRSEAALSAIDNAIGHFKDNPAAITAGLDQLDKANTGFMQKGTVRATGSNVASNPPASAEQKIRYSANGRTFNIPASQEKEFLKDFPGARKQ